MWKIGKKDKKSNNTHGVKIVVPYSDHFKGFKIFRVVVHGDEESERNNEIFCETGLSGVTAEFVLFDARADLYLNGMKIGTVLEPDEVSAIREGRIEKIHAEKKADRRLHFFAKYKEYV